MSANKVIIILVTILSLIICCGKYTNQKHSEKQLYNNDDYYLVDVYADSDVTYSGAIAIEDFGRWCNDEDGSMFVYSEKGNVEIEISDIEQIVIK